MKNNLFFVICYLFTCCLPAMAQTDVTEYIQDADFEKEGRSVWTTGVVGGSFGRQTNSDFPMKHATAYRETWSGGDHVGDAEIYQDLTNLPVGTYTLTVACQNIKQSNTSQVCTGAWIFANDQKTEFNKAADYSVTCVVTDGALRVGAETKDCTGNYVCIDHFRLSYQFIYEDVKDYVTNLIAKVDEVDLKDDSAERTELLAARDALKQIVESQQTDGIDLAMKRLESALQAYSYSIASPSNPMNLTRLIENPSFEEGDNGWKFEDMGRQNNNSYPSKVGDYYVERWTGSSKVDKGLVQQTVVNLPNGRYRLTANARNVWEGSENVKQTGAYLYGESEQVEVGLDKVYSVEFVTICGEAIIGFKGDGATGNWICVDNFQLYFLGSDAAEESKCFNALIAEAEELTAGTMNTDVKEALDKAIADAKAIEGNLGRADAAKALKEAISNTKQSVLLYAELMQYIESATAVLSGTGENGKDELSEVIATAQTNYDSGKIDRETVDNAKKALEKAVFCYKVKNGSGTTPKVTTHPTVIVGCNAMVGRMSATGSNIIERGFCWAENPNPTVLDEHSSYSQTNDETNNSPVYVMYDVKASTEYWVRAYAVTKTYAVGYGEPVRVITLPQGETVYNFLWNGDDQHNEWLDNAMREATAYYNTWTAIKGFRPTANYSPGTETADCSYGGWINVGPWRCNTGTMVHEMMHGTGVGQHGRWWDSNLHNLDVSVVWLGERANRVTHFFENYDSSRGNYNCNGDGMHVCYEGNGNDMQQIRSAILMQALYEDGLPAVSDGACPFYSYESIDSLKYYISNDAYGLGTKFLCESTLGKLNYAAVSKAEALQDDAHAWYLLYDKMTGLYRIRNVKSGKYFSFSSSVTLKSTETPTQNEYIQLMPARITQKMDAGSKTLSMKPYWFARANRVCDPNVMSVASSTTKTVSTPVLDFSNKATAQFWVIFNEQEMADLQEGQLVMNKACMERLIEGSKKLVTEEHLQGAENADETFVKAYEAIEMEKEAYATVEQIETAVTALYQNVADFLLNITPATRLDLTFLLDNANLETETGWNNLPEISDGKLNVAGTTFNFSQTIPVKMPKGNYGLMVRGFERPSDATTCMKDFVKGTNDVSTRIVCRNKTQKIKHIGEGGQAARLGEGGTESKVQNLYIPTNIKAAGAYLNHGFYDNMLPFTLTSASSLSLGLKNETTNENKWVVVDGFELYYYGLEGSATSIEDIDCEEVGDNVYDLQGRKVQVTRKGLYIKNGKLQIVK